MATVPIFIGQCGNQVGYKLDCTKLLNSVCKSDNRQTGDQEYRCSVLVDSEPKVINSLNTVQCKISQPGRRNTKLKVERRTRYGNSISGLRGRGNNWALGYNGLGTEKILESTVEAVRKEAERCEIFTNILLIHSLCGGTGGGLGSRLLEELRQQYPLQQIVSAAVSPFISGDTPLQHYNALLSLTALQKFADGVLLFRNDIVEAYYKQIGKTSISYDMMNEYISDCLAGIILPTDTLNPSRQSCCDLELSELVRSICPQPSLKFLTTSHVSRKSDDFKSLVMSAASHFKRSGSHTTKCRSLSSLVVLRGSATTDCYDTLGSIENRLNKELNCVSWNPFPVDFWMASTSLPRVTGPTKEVNDVTLVSNYSNIISLTEHAHNRAELMYREKAYVHWYYKHGITEDYFDEAFDTVYEITSCYQEAIR